MSFLNVDWLYALAAIPLLLVLRALFDLSRARTPHRWFGPRLARALAPRVIIFRRLAKGFAIVGSVAAVAIALARPVWNPQPRPTEVSGRDVVFLVDVSRSMLAEDVAPNRLTRAKLLASDALEAARGDRVALVAFAGTSAVKAPLTTDYGFVRLSLDGLSPDSVARGGSLIGDAIRTTVDAVFGLGEPGSDPDTNRFRDIILITDGEDHESFPVEAAAAAGTLGIRIIVVGLGSEIGATVPAPSDHPVTGRPGVTQPRPQGSGPLVHDGSVVESRIDPTTLTSIAAATPGGVYLDVRTGHIDMDRVYARLVGDAEHRNLGHTESMRYDEGFQIALLAAFVLLLFEGLIRDTSPAR